VSKPFNYKILRVMRDKEGMFFIQTRYFGFIWWTIFKTYHEKGVVAFLDFSGLVYNQRTGNYEQALDE